MKYFAISLFISLSLFGCKTEETKTVSFYKANSEERISKIEECKENPGELSDSPNCKNAKQATLEMAKGDPNKYRVK